MIIQPLPSTASAMLTISSTAIGLKDAIIAADSPASDNYDFEDGANFVHLTVESKPIRYTTDGNTPTTTTGVLAYEGDNITLNGIDLRNLKMIRQTGDDATVVVTGIGKMKQGEF